MVYTKEQLEKMDDLQINLAVAKKIYDENEIREVTSFVHRKIVLVEVAVNQNEFNPCLDWNDVMPIAEKYGMVIELSYSFESRATKGIDGIGSFFESYNENPRRAICEVFLMMEINND